MLESNNTTEWFSIKNTKNEIIDYSKDFTFFLENQIFIKYTKKKIKFMSRIESKIFKELDMNFIYNEISDDEINLIIKKIHVDLLNGVFGENVN